MSNTNSPLVSVIIPTYNYARFVGEAVESALAQTYPNLEIIVVDDGSIDDTRAILMQYASRIRYVFQKNQGLSASRNNGIAIANGELIALLDSDDYWHPRKLELQVKYLTLNPSVGLLAAQHRSDASDGWPAIVEANALAAKRFSLEQIATRMRFNPSGIVVRKSVIDEIGDFDTSLRACEDRDFCIRAAACTQISMLTTTLWHYRIHGNNMSSGAALMERNERATIEKAFHTVPSLRPRRLLRRKALGYAAFSSSYIYDGDSHHAKALWKLAESILLWPLPFDADDVKARNVRIKRVAMLCLRMLRLKPSLRIIDRDRLAARSAIVSVQG